jgi:hypothetical protein
METGFYGTFGVYHSAYDDLHYAQTQADPYFVDHRSEAELLALFAYRMTEGPLPYSLSAYVEPMRRALAQLQANNGTGSDFSPLRDAIDKFAVADGTFERAATDGGRAIEAVHALNLLFYGRSGYAAVAFPTVAGAMSSGNATAVQDAIAKTSSSLDAVASMLAP